VRAVLSPPPPSFLARSAIFFGLAPSTPAKRAPVFLAPTRDFWPMRFWTNLFLRLTLLCSLGMMRAKRCIRRITPDRIQTPQTLVAGETCPASTSNVNPWFTIGASCSWISPLVVQFAIFCPNDCPLQCAEAFLSCTMRRNLSYWTWPQPLWPQCSTFILSVPFARPPPLPTRENSLESAPILFYSPTTFTVFSAVCWSYRAIRLVLFGALRPLFQSNLLQPTLCVICLRVFFYWSGRSGLIVSFSLLDSNALQLSVRPFVSSCVQGPCC